MRQTHPWIKKGLLTQLTLVAALGLSLLVSSKAEAAVWVEKNQWSSAWEQRFSSFIQGVPLDYLNNPNYPFGRVETDCADAVYTLRIIFAYFNDLPVQFTTTQGMITNRTTRFNHIQNEKSRVRAFFEYVNRFTDTATLTRDTYPIAIRPNTLIPGVVFLHPRTGSSTPITYRPGHVYYVRQVYDNGIIEYASSTVPIRARDLDVRYGIHFAPLYRNSGFRAFRWPHTQSQPNYSEEQYNMAGWYERSFQDYELADRWQEAVRSRIGSRRPQPSESFNAALANTMAALDARIRVVNSGWNAYQRRYQGRSCMNSSDYDAYSTPTRDVRLQNELYFLRKAALQMGGSVERTFASYQVEIQPGVRIDLNQVWRAFMTETALQISEPEHSPLVRWGVQNQGTWPCPHRRSQYRGANGT